MLNATQETKSKMQVRLEPFLDSNLQFRNVKDGGISEVYRLASGIDDKGVWQPLRFSKKITAKKELDLSRLIKYEDNFLFTLASHDATVKVVQSLGHSTEVKNDGSGEIVHKLLTKNAGVDIYRWYYLPVKLEQNGQYYYSLFCHPGALLQLIRGCLLAFESIHKHGVVHCDIKEDQICIPFELKQQGNNTYFLSPKFEDVTLIDFGTALWEEVSIQSWVNPLPFNVKHPLPYQAKALMSAVEKQHAYKKQYKKYNFKGALQDVDYGVDLYSFGYLLHNMFEKMISKHLNVNDLKGWNVFLDDYKQWLDELLNQSYGIMPPYNREHLPYTDYLRKVDEWIEKVDVALGYSSKTLQCIVDIQDDVRDSNLGIYLGSTPLADPSEVGSSLSTIHKPDGVLPDNKPKAKWSWKKKLLIALCVPVVLFILFVIWAVKTAPDIPVEESSLDTNTQIEHKATHPTAVEKPVALIEKSKMKELGGYGLDMVQGTAIQPKTNLTWRRCLLGQDWDSQSEQCVGDVKKYHTDDVQMAIQALNKQTGVKWRMADVQELGTLDKCSTPQKMDITMGSGKYSLRIVCKDGHQTLNQDVFKGWTQPALTSTMVNSADIKTLFKNDGRTGYWAIDLGSGHAGRIEKADEAIVPLVLDK